MPCASDDGSEDDNLIEPDRFIVMVTVMAACTLFAIPIGCVARGRDGAPRQLTAAERRAAGGAADVEPYVIVYSPGGERAAGKPV